ANMQKQVEMGLKSVEKISADDIAKTFPLLKTDDVLGGNFCSTDGFVDPYSAMIGFMTRASEQGARLWRGAEVTGISTDCNGVAAVATSRDIISTRAVVNAAGAWAAQVAKIVSIDLPVMPLRRMLVPTEPFSDYPHTAP